MNRTIIYRILTGLAVISALPGCSNGGRETLDLKTEEDLHGLTITTSAGNYYDEKYSAYDDIDIFRVSFEADGIQAVRQGMADVFVSDEVALTPEDRDRLQMKVAFRGEESFDVAFAVRKGDLALQEALNSFIEEGKADGTIDAIISHWTKGTPAPEMPAQAEVTSTGKPLRCVTAVNLAPVSFVGEGGQWMGMDADILRRFATLGGREFQMQFQELGSC